MPARSGPALSSRRDSRPPSQPAGGNRRSISYWGRDSGGPWASLALVLGSSRSGWTPLASDRSTESQSDLHSIPRSLDGSCLKGIIGISRRWVWQDFLACSTCLPLLILPGQGSPWKKDLCEKVALPLFGWPCLSSDGERSLIRSGRNGTALSLDDQNPRISFTSIGQVTPQKRISFPVCSLVNKRPYLTSGSGHACFRVLYLQ